MTADEFRALALALPGATEGAHMGHPDFRANGRIFATLSTPPVQRGMVALPLEEAAMRVEAAPAIFAPAAGAWGRNGSTLVALEAADTDAVRGALAAAHAAAITRPQGRGRKQSS